MTRLILPAAFGLYCLIGLARLWRAAGPGHGVRVLNAVCLLGGALTLVLVLGEPVDALADEVQWGHMLQHVVLIAVAPVLVLLGMPARVLPWALSRNLRVRLARWFTRMTGLRTAIAAAASAPAAFALHAAAIVFWHLPAPYDAAVRHETLHAIEHLTFFATALVFWRAVLARAPERGLPPGVRIPYVIAMSLVGGALGAVLTFAGAPLYDVYLATAPAHGLTPLEDQQLAGLIMWIPGGLAYLVAAGALFVQWLRRADARADREVVWQRA